MKKDVVVRFVGSAGDGLVSLGTLFGRILKKHNLNVLGFRSYQSVIRGGYNTYQIRASQDEVLSVGEEADIIVLLNKHVAKLHKPAVNKGAKIIYDSEVIDLDEFEYPSDIVKLEIPLASITKEISKLKILKNIVGFGAIIQILGLDETLTKEVIFEQFGRKGEEVVFTNYEALEKGEKFAQENNWPIVWEKHKYEKAQQMLISGNEALALGMISAGLKFYSGYPMTPATSIVHYLTKHLPKLGMIVKQTEDELAAVGMAIGAAYTGARSATGTSGGGFSLMTELIGMAGIEEIPLVVINSQRAGPSTGMATKTAQADLFQVYGASQGEFPKVIIAPCSPEESFLVGIEAIEIAEKYQVVVIILMDLYLSEQIATIKDLELKRKNTRFGIESNPKSKFVRYKITKNGVSPRTIPGTLNGMHFTGSSERNEEGTSLASTLAGLPDTLPIREAMVEKRMRKLDFVLKELPEPEFFGPANAEITFVTWGSTKNIVKEAILELKSDGIEANHLHLKYLNPFHTERVTNLLEKTSKTICVEQNFTGQMSDYLRMKTGISVDAYLRRWDGEPITTTQVVEKAKEVIGNE
ncbi:MAG: 2-oxoacid:acceptor oxidoreductase subunit alpha [Candidatus Heimdallarchaeota archaeon]|nr:2-oxoacid:acceptor oxidoreductase subunit alpha [Candidatus Heimdallarchaeota archaeon]MCK4771118.1 2-oxoacid:acceptor oxidoreductase subunit alpha [Candidatus Heimdallarchaeota archaeon]